MDILERVWRRLVLLIGRGRITFVDDAGSVQRVQVQLGSEETKDGIPRLCEYGFQSRPPAGSDAVVLFLAGERTNAVVIACGSQQYRMRSLADGEVAISDDKGQFVYLSAAGIRVQGNDKPIQVDTTSSVTVNASSAHLVCSGNVQIDAATLHVNADTTFVGTVTANGHRIDETHRHSGVSSGASNTGTVT